MARVEGPQDDGHGLLGALQALRIRSVDSIMILPSRLRHAEFVPFGIGHDRPDVAIVVVPGRESLPVQRQRWFHPGLQHSAGIPLCWGRRDNGSGRLCCLQVLVIASVLAGYVHADALIETHRTGFVAGIHPKAHAPYSPRVERGESLP